MISRGISPPGYCLRSRLARLARRRRVIPEPWRCRNFNPPVAFAPRTRVAVPAAAGRSPPELSAPVTMANIYKIARALPFSGFFRKLEQEADTVINVLQPGPLGIIQHKFSAQEIREAKATVSRTVDNWRRHSELEHATGLLKDYILK